MELTKEYFDKALKNIVTKKDLDERLSTTEKRLIKRIDDAQEELALMTKRGFDEVYKQLDVRTKVEELEHQMHEVRQELNLA